MLTLAFQRHSQSRRERTVTERGAASHMTTTDLLQRALMTACLPHFLFLQSGTPPQERS